MFASFKVIEYRKNEFGKFDYPQQRILEMEPTFNEDDGSLNMNKKVIFRLLRLGEDDGERKLMQVFDNSAVLCPDVLQTDNLSCEMMLMQEVSR